MTSDKKIISGFTLIELAVVLVIVGLLLGGVLGTLSSRIENTRKNETIKELEEIKQAMIAFAYVNKRLPCPDCDVAGPNCNAGLVGDGIEDLTVGVCTEGQNLGHVPWATLGLGASDAWGTRYRYSVQSDYAATGLPAQPLFDLDSADGSASIEEPDFSTVTVPPGGASKNLANKVVAIIFSHGKNGYGGITVNNTARAAIPAANIDEANNTDNDGTYYTRPETGSQANIAGGEFDDILIWISEFELKGKMVRAGAFP